MPHRISSVGNFDIVDNDCTFVIPAINDTTRILEKCVYNIASFKTDKPYRPGTPVFLHGRDKQAWTVSDKPANSEGFIGIVVENDLTEKAVSIQLTGSAWVRFQTDAANIGKYLLYDGTIDSGAADSFHIIGKITGVIGTNIYEVLLHSLPRPEVTQKKVVKGLPFEAATKATVNVSDRLFYVAHTLELAWNGADTGQGFSILSGSATPVLGGTGTDLTLTFQDEYVSGSATASTYDHQAVPKDPTPAGTIAVSCKLAEKVLTVFSPPSKTFYNYGPFKMRVTVHGWAK